MFISIFYYERLFYYDEIILSTHINSATYLQVNTKTIIKKVLRDIQDLVESYPEQGEQIVTALKTGGFSANFIMGFKQDLSVELFSKFLKTIKENETLKNQYLIYSNLQNTKFDDSVQAR